MANDLSPVISVTRHSRESGNLLVWGTPAKKIAETDFEDANAV
jgi:hypothetical protein